MAFAGFAALLAPVAPPPFVGLGADRKAVATTGAMYVSYSAAVLHAHRASDALMWGSDHASNSGRATLNRGRYLAFHYCKMLLNLMAWHALHRSDIALPDVLDAPALPGQAFRDFTFDRPQILQHLVVAE